MNVSTKRVNMGVTVSIYGHEGKHMQQWLISIKVESPAEGFIDASTRTGLGQTSSEIMSPATGCLSRSGCGGKGPMDRDNSTSENP
jgi:hypothetical protein